MAKWMTSAAIVVAMTACGAKGKGPATGTMNSGPTTTTPVPAPHYAALFKEGATWSYDLKSTATGGENPDDKTETTGAATCKVASVGTFAGGMPPASLPPPCSLVPLRLAPSLRPRRLRPVALLPPSAGRCFADGAKACASPRGARLSR